MSYFFENVVIIEVAFLPFICAEGKENIDEVGQEDYEDKANFVCKVIWDRTLNQVHESVEERARQVAGHGENPRRIAHHQMNVPECHQKDCAALLTFKTYLNR